MALIQSPYLHLAISLFTLGFIILYHLGPKYDPREPPVIPQKIPYIGHLMKLIFHGQEYLDRLSKKHNLPVYTLQILTKRVYVVCSLDLVLAVQKDAKRVSLNPFMINFIPFMFGFGKEDMKIVALNHDGGQGDWGFLPENHIKAYSALAPGLDMDIMIRSALSMARNLFNDLEKQTENNSMEIDLYTWIREFMTLVNTEALFGPENPFKHEPGLVNSFWDYEAGLAKLIRPFPKFTASQAYSARLRISAAVHSYLSRNGHDQASALQRSRYEVGNKCGVSPEGIARLAMGDLIAALANTVPTVFWLIWHIYSTPVLLHELRGELTGILSEIIGEDGQRYLRLNVGMLKNHCPLLFSTYQEVLRVRTHSAAHRWVVEDSLVLNRFLLKKGNPVELPGHVVHSAASLWGPDVDNFNPRRFIKSNKDYNVKVGSLRSFGGGKTLCPGRSFATQEILSLVAMMMLRYDISPLGVEAWPEPPYASGKLLSIITPPAEDIRVVVSNRDGYRDVQWGFDRVHDEDGDTSLGDGT